ncbi:hypothetical protein HMI54_010698 [Coelomomyces lativittatus]|nr:hypothetical protein HMI54_010698 [Coelomomyces lativittatus]KAJ1501546.1 hypothetical protein HMI55_003338 [Coelomomyces lativittatus]KAJ1508509.1 hypothetical protein HMI56_007259 [Coelomomyces lativittatus]
MSTPTSSSLSSLLRKHVPLIHFLGPRQPAKKKLPPPPPPPSSSPFPSSLSSKVLSKATVASSNHPPTSPFIMVPSSSPSTHPVSLHLDSTPDLGRPKRGSPAWTHREMEVIELGGNVLFSIKEK